MTRLLATIGQSLLALALALSSGLNSSCARTPRPAPTPKPFDPEDQGDIESRLTAPPGARKYQLARSVSDAFGAIRKFARSHGWRDRLPGLLERVEIVATQDELRQRLLRLGIADDEASTRTMSHTRRRCRNPQGS